jgi:hypothetical protein
VPAATAQKEKWIAVVVMIPSADILLASLNGFWHLTAIVSELVTAIEGLCTTGVISGLSRGEIPLLDSGILNSQTSA